MIGQPHARPYNGPSLEESHLPVFAPFLDRPDQGVVRGEGSGGWVEVNAVVDGPSRLLRMRTAE